MHYSKEEIERMSNKDALALLCLLSLLFVGYYVVQTFQFIKWCLEECCLTVLYWKFRLVQKIKGHDGQW